MTWIPYPRPKFYAAEYAEAQGFVLTAGHDGTWVVWKSGSLEQHGDALLRGETIDVGVEVLTRASADLYPSNPAKNLGEAKAAAEAALNDMISTTNG